MCASGSGRSFSGRPFFIDLALIQFKSYIVNSHSYNIQLVWQKPCFDFWPFGSFTK